MSNTTRRSFLKTAVAGGAVAASGQEAQAKRSRYKRKSPASTELIEVGVITCAYFSHIEDHEKYDNTNFKNKDVYSL